MLSIVDRPMSTNGHRQPDQKLRRLQAQILQLDLICSGTLYRRFRKCGKPSCRCASDPEARHGPYYQWSHMEDGRQVHANVSPTLARRLEQAQRNYRKVLRLLERWERESLRIIQAATTKTPRIGGEEPP
jgi:hypothetical protein